MKVQLDTEMTSRAQALPQAEVSPPGLGEYKVGNGPVEKQALQREQSQQREQVQELRENRAALRLGDSGAAVEWLQSELGMHVTGTFDKQTLEAVQEFQRTHSIFDDRGQRRQLLVDGVVAARTVRALDEAAGRETLDMTTFQSVIGNDWYGRGYGLIQRGSSSAPQESAVLKGDGASLHTAFTYSVDADEQRQLKSLSDFENLDTHLAAAIRQAASRLGVHPVDLAAVIDFETGGTFDPAVRNQAGSGAVGLIQFMPSTARGLGTSSSELASMTAVEQMEYVERYFAPYRGKLNDFDDLYMAVLYPRAVGKDSDYALFTEGTRAYEQNPMDYNADGVVTRGEATKKVQLRRWG